jgi:hypothetical protein
MNNRLMNINKNINNINNDRAEFTSHNNQRILPLEASTVILSEVISN